MRRVLLAGALLALSSAPAHADDSTPTDDAPSGLSVDPDANTSVLPEVAATLRARVTFYVQSGLMASGQTTRPGAAACSTNLPMHTRPRMSDDRVVTCLDRGDLGNGSPVSWVDIYASTLAWGRANVSRVYGDVTTVEVLSE